MPNPVLDRNVLEKAFANYIPDAQSSIPNIPHQAPSLPVPSIGNEPTPSALSALENNLIKITDKSTGKLTGGSIPRTLAEVSSNRFNNYVPGDYDNEDAYAQGQGWPSKMVNGVGKGLSLAGTTFLQTTVGTVNGIARSLEDGRAASFYDNEFNRKLDEWNKELENNLPNYYTNLENTSNWYSPSKLLTGNFLWDGIVKNLGFAVGAVGSGYLFSAGTKSLASLPMLSRLFSVGRAAEALAATEESLIAGNRAAETYGKVKVLSDKFLNTYNTLNTGQRVLVAGLSTIGEAGFEAYHNLNDFRNQKIEEYKNSHDGYAPIGEDLDKINRESDAVGNSSVLLNTALLTATNYIQFPKILGSSTRSERLAINSLSKEIEDLATGEAGKYVARKGKSKILAGLNSVRPYLFSSSEAVEEGSQYAITIGTQHYYNKQYKNEDVSWVDSLYEGIGKTLSTNEGAENILIGGLSGALMLGRGKYLANREKSKNTLDAIKQFNEYKLSDFTKSTINSVNRGVVLQEDREKALKEGNILESKDLEADYVINYLTPRIKYDRFDLVQSDINDYRTLASTEEGFSQLQAEGKALPTDTRQAYIQRLSDLENTAINTKSLYQSLVLRYGGYRNKDNSPVYTPEVLDKMIYSATKVADYDKRIPQVSEKLLLVGIDTQSIVDEVYKFGKPSKEFIDQTIKKIESLNSINEDELKEALGDLVELSKRRKLFLEEYQDIKNNPTKYSEKADEEKRELVDNAGFINSEDNKERVEIGREYISPEKKEYKTRKVGDDKWAVVHPDGSLTYENTEEEALSTAEVLNDESNRLSKIKVLNFNNEGLVQVQDNSGKILDLSLEALTGYERVVTEEEKEIERLNKNEQLKREILGTADKNVNTTVSDKPYTLEHKKDNLQVVTSTKPVTESTLPHHKRANLFGANWWDLPNRDNIVGAIATSNTEGKIGLEGLTTFLKDQSDAPQPEKDKVDPSKTVVMVMVDSKTGKPVGVDGESLEAPTFENTIFQVMPDPKLSWDKKWSRNNQEESMFREGQDPELITFFKDNYEKLNQKRLESTDIEYHQIIPSPGKIEVVERIDEKGNKQPVLDAITSVTEAALIKQGDLSSKPVVEVSTKDSKFTIQGREGTISVPVGRPVLNTGSNVIPLNNRKLTKQETEAIYGALLALSKEPSMQTEKAKRITHWLKTVIYWGKPSNDAGYNSLFISDDFQQLVISGKGYNIPFTTASIEASKDILIGALSNMYNNVNNTQVKRSDLWNQPYEEITEIDSKGDIKSRIWKNYQSFLLSDKYDLIGTTEDKKRNPKELPLFTRFKPVTSKDETNKKGIYFTITDDIDKWIAPEKVVITPAKKEAPKETQAPYVLDGKTINTFTSPAGKKITFKATSIEDESLDNIILGTESGDYKEIKKNNPDKDIDTLLKTAIFNSIAEQQAEEIPVEEEVIEEPKPKKGLRFEKRSEDVEISLKGSSKEEVTSSLARMIRNSSTGKSVQRIKLLEQIKNFKPENWNEVESWLKENIPNVPVYRVKNVIRSTNGQQAWGMFKDGAIYIYENAEVGTVYHEVFHSVWRMFSDKTEQDSVINEFKNRKGSFIERSTGESIEYKTATNEQVEEKLAEEFRDFVVDRKVPVKPSQGRPFIIKLFNDLVDFIKSFFTGDKAQSNTKNLFDKIGKGYYKTFVPTQGLEFAKPGITDISEVLDTFGSQFSIIGIPQSTVHDIMQHMTYTTLTYLQNKNEGLFNVASTNKSELYNTLKDEVLTVIGETQDTLDDLIADKQITEEEAKPFRDINKALQQTIEEQWRDIVKKHQEYLKAYSIEFDENDQIKDIEKSKEDPYGDALKVDAFRKANGAIKMLLSTIPVVDENKVWKTSSINGVILLPALEAYLAIKNKVYTSNTIDEMLSRLREMADEDANYDSVYRRLMGNAVNLSEVTDKNKNKLLSAFWKTMKQQNADVKIVNILDNGDVNVIDANTLSAVKQQENDFISSIIKTLKRKNPFLEYSASKKVYIPKANNYKTDTAANQIAFLKALGINFSNKEVYNLKKENFKRFQDGVKGLKIALSTLKNPKSISVKSLDISGNITNLSIAKVASTNPEIGSTFQNINGERVQTFIGVNTLSLLHDYISQIEKKEDLLNTPYSYLVTDVFSQHSVIMDLIFDKDGNKIPGSEKYLKAGWAGGLLDQRKGKRVESSRATQKQRMLQEINLNLNGYFYNLVPGDATMEHMVYMGKQILPSTLLSGYSKVFDIFKGYLISEIDLARDNRKIVSPKGSNRSNKDLRFLQGILSEETIKKIQKSKKSGEEIYEELNKPKGVDQIGDIDREVKEYFEKQANKRKNILQSYGIVSKQENGDYSISGLSMDKSMSEATLDRELQAIEINYNIANIELHKVLYSDPYQYSDELKRVKLATSPKQPIVNTSLEMNSAYNEVWNKGYKEEDLGYTDFTKDYFTTVVASDVKVSSPLKDYGVFDETDGGGMISQKAHRLLRIKAGDWNDAEEAQYRYDIEYWEKDKAGTLSNKFLEKNPKIQSTYTPLKPAVFGNRVDGQNYNSIIGDKFSLYPLSYRVMKELNAPNGVKLIEKLEKETVDYVVYDSGRKVGEKQLHNLYNEDGSFNTADFPKVVKVPHNIITIQAEVPSKENTEVTRGSQVTKLVTLDYMEAGVPIDFQPSENYRDRYTNWFKLSSEEKKKESPLYSDIIKNQELLDKITANGINTLLRRLKIKQTPEGGYVIEDLSETAKALRSEVLKREVNDNIIASLDGFLNGKVVLEATPLYHQIRNILYSIADKNFISPKINGRQGVQIASTLFEKERIPFKHEKGNVFTSTDLKFYELKDGKVQYAEIMVGRWWMDNSTTKNMTDEELLEYLNKPENKDILEGVAFRIPTQKQNSIEVFKIAKLLPREFGDSVVVPSELVKKAGSDFDIDKLNIYLKNLDVDKKGLPKIVEEQNREFFENQYEKRIEKEINKIERFDEFRNKVVEIFQQIESIEDPTKITPEGLKFLLGEENYDYYEFHKEKFSEILAQAIDNDVLPSDYISSQIKALSEKKEKLTEKLLNEVLKQGYVDRMYKKGLENAYIQSMQSLIANPLNFEQLVKPNSAEELKQLSQEIVKQRGLDPFDYQKVSNLLDWSFMTNLRQAFVSGKYAIGIAAVNQTNHSLNQRQPIYIDRAKLANVDPEDRQWLGDASIRFKQYNSIVIGNKVYPTLSFIKNKADEYISDIIGMFIDGYVDISKGPWIMELGAYPNVASTWLFLTKIGVPIKDVAYFMNQPIIRDYLQSIENEGYSWLFIEDYVDDIKDKYPASDKELASIKEIPATKKLFNNINRKNLNNAEQQFILDEFLKYAMMAKHSFYVTQATNFDTANFNDPFLIFKKIKMLEKAKNSIINDVDAILDNSFLKRLQTALYDIRDAYSEILVSDKDNVREVLETALEPYIELNDRDFLQVARKAVNTLFDWAVQTDPEFQASLKDSLIGDTNKAEEVVDFVNSVKRDDGHPLFNNQIIKLISINRASREERVSNLKIKNKDNKVYDQNMIIAAFAELREHLKNEKSNLYQDIVNLAVFQSGLSYSPTSFTSILPYQDFQNVYNKAISNLNSLSYLENFNTLRIFERTNWNDGNITPYKAARFTPKSSGGSEYNKQMNFKRIPNLDIAIKTGVLPQLLKLNIKAKESGDDIIVYTWESGLELLSDEQRKQPLNKQYEALKQLKTDMRKSGDYSYINKGLFQKVYRGEEPLFNSYKFTDKEGKEVNVIDYIYKPINAWGDSHSEGNVYFSANEFYNEARPSIIDNGFIKVKEVDDSTIISIFDGKTKRVTRVVEASIEEPSNSTIPKCS